MNRYERHQRAVRAAAERNRVRAEAAFPNEHRVVSAEYGVWIADPENGQLINVSHSHDARQQEEEWRRSLRASGFEDRDIDRFQAEIRRKRLRRGKGKGKGVFNDFLEPDLGYLRGRKR